MLVFSKSKNLFAVFANKILARLGFYTISPNPLKKGALMMNDYVNSSPWTQYSRKSSLLFLSSLAQTVYLVSVPDKGDMQ